MNLLVNLTGEKLEEFEAFRPQDTEAEPPEWHSVIKGYWSETLYNSGYHAYSACVTKDGYWLLNQCTRHGCLDSVSEEDVEAGALNDDQSQVLHHFDGCLQSAIEWHYDMICAVWLDPPKGLTAQEAGLLLYEEFVDRGGMAVED